MKTINLKKVICSSLLVYVIGITFYIGSYYLPILENPELQSNIVLAIAIIPASILGAAFYYRNNTITNGLTLGLLLFFITVILDACITVPVFIIPEGGNHYDFFTNLWFWFIGVEYVFSVYLYSRYKKPVNVKRSVVNRL
ncbi:MAG: DUF5367 family protein [Bacteroidota bacterium]